MKNGKRRPTQQEINNALWAACDMSRGVVDPAASKNSLLVFLRLKYLNDVWKEHHATLRRKYGNNTKLIERKMARERFILPAHSRFVYLSAPKNEPIIGEIINKAPKPWKKPTG